MDQSSVSFGLKGRVIAVTGACSGIGLATSKLLSRNGAKVAILDINRDAIDKAVAEVSAEGTPASGYVVDVRDPESVERIVSDVETNLGPTRGVVACAGVSGAMPSAELTLAELDRVMSVNTQGVFLTLQGFGRRMIARKEGSLVAMSSVGSFGGQAARLPYVTSKWAVNGIIKTLAVEWGRHNVRVNGIAPTFVDTPMVRTLVPKNFFNAMCDRTPMGRGALPDEIAPPIAFLLSDAAQLVTGIIMPVDAGITAGFLTRKNGSDLASFKLIEQGVYADE